MTNYTFFKDFFLTSVSVLERPSVALGSSLLLAVSLSSYPRRTFPPSAPFPQPLPLTLVWPPSWQCAGLALISGSSMYMVLCSQISHAISYLLTDPEPSRAGNGRDSRIYSLLFLRITRAKHFIHFPPKFPPFFPQGIFLSLLRWCDGHSCLLSVLCSIACPSSQDSNRVSLKYPEILQWFLEQC